MTARFVTVPEVEQMLWRERDKAAVYDEMQSVGLLVIDDFGCERRTEYMDEIKFNLIDGRLRSGKPCVITTNLTMNEFSAPSDRGMKRIVSRLFERVNTFHVQGEDRRFAMLRERAGGQCPLPISSGSRQRGSPSGQCPPPFPSGSRQHGSPNIHSTRRGAASHS